MKEFWDQRFGSVEYAYGEMPNEYFKSKIFEFKPGKILLPAEGEGRNAVFAAKLGWEVFAYDYSNEGKRKAEKLAQRNNVEINYLLSTHEKFNAENELFDCIALIYVHPAPGNRSEFHKKLIKYLKPGGTIILEGFSKEQIHKNTGGPKNIDMLFSIEELKNDFSGLSSLESIKTEIIFNEGVFHRGTASVVRALGIK